MTAVEWLVDQLKSTKKKYMGYKNIDIDYKEIIEQAKEMEKEQIIDAWDDGCYQSSDFPRTSDAERYYNETFKSE